MRRSMRKAFLCYTIILGIFWVSCRPQYLYVFSICNVTMVITASSIASKRQGTIDHLMDNDE